ncbi:RagB/SusD family nutrient uptake outer membrane protein [Algibacter pacificus]|uniref:RagB/SusD family nutrient uptake outer membrane protein n=1 Tax=Algibacter pacificus TaxID=2599389 RepID=UPI0011CBF1EC|nr:RagB/SusD family nutrient uptake outer membrane protein [Algibacter pacificus]
MNKINIKTNVYKLLLLVTLILTNSCSEDFIDLSPKSNANVETFFKNQEDIERAINGSYSALTLSGVYGTSMPILGELRSDNAEMGSTASSRANYYALSEFRTQATFSLYEDTWDDHYEGISRVNLILSKIEDISMDENDKKRIKGECTFLRGIFYFNLVRVFGAVPLVTKNLTSIEESYSYGRNEVQEVYEQIVEDFSYAKETLPVSVNEDEIGRATQGAALAMLGKVYLTIGNYNSAKEKLIELIQTGRYKLLDNYADLWDVSKENHAESIFDVQMEASDTYDTASNYAERFFPYGYVNMGVITASGGYNIPTEDMIAAYETGDIRKNISIQESWTSGDDEITGLEGRFCTKYSDFPANTASGSDDNWPVIRYADVLLMYAEALNEIGYQANGEAFKYLNLIRNRAGLLDKTSNNSNPELLISNQEEFRLALEQERRVELAFEGHRWFDLVRTKRAIEVMSSQNGGISNYQLLYPIPQSQIDVNPDKIKQNPEY